MNYTLAELKAIREHMLAELEALDECIELMEETQHYKAVVAHQDEIREAHHEQQVQRLNNLLD
jgi:hypothetical protein